MCPSPNSHPQPVRRLRPLEPLSSDRMRGHSSGHEPWARNQEVAPGGGTSAAQVRLLCGRVTSSLRVTGAVQLQGGGRKGTWPLARDRKLPKKKEQALAAPVTQTHVLSAMLPAASVGGILAQSHAVGLRGF